VYQSFRATNVPAWLERCLQSVREWTASQGFDYEFVDDRLFHYAPMWYREKVADNILLVSDLARLELAHEFLRKGYQRTIWFDADLLIFAPAKLRIEVADENSFCRELWIEPGAGQTLTVHRQVNNAVTVFTIGNTFLEFYRNACLRLVRHQPNVHPHAVSTRFLTILNNVMTLPLIDHIGTFSPMVMADLAQGGGKSSRAYRQIFGTDLYAANLCGSFRGQRAHDVEMVDRVYEGAIATLLKTQGTLLECPR
jgi:hypothetical protein